MGFAPCSLWRIPWGPRQEGLGGPTCAAGPDSFAGIEKRGQFFSADAPDRYAPVNSGDDVVLFLEQGRSVSGCREHGLQFDGHVYLFASEGTLEKFRSNPRYYADRALHAMRSAETAAVR